VKNPSIFDPQPGSIYASIDAFYEANPLRKRSGEMDFGCWWTDGDKGPPYYRVSVVMDTGEVYAIRVGPGRRDQPIGEVELIGTIIVNTEPDPEDRFPAVYKQADTVVLNRWVDHIHTARSLEWVRERVRGQ
jgi:hypothetical protein